MKFLIKNYNKDADSNKEMLATVLFEVKTIKEAQEKMADFIAKIKNNWEADFSKDRKKFTATAMIVNLYHILDGMDIENYRNGNHEEFLSKFDFNTRNVINPTDKPIVAFLSDLMLKQETEADCMADINWCFDFTDNLPKIIFEKSKFDISGMYFQDQEEYLDDETFEMKIPFDNVSYNIWQIPLNKFEEYVKKIPDAWMDDDFGFLFSARNY